MKQSPRSEIQARLVRFYQTRYPDDLRIEVRNVTGISEGWETEIYTFDLVHGPTGSSERQPKHQPLILRLYPGDGAEQKAVHEYAAMRQLYQSGYPVPQVLLLERESALFGKPFVVMERIEGRPLGTAIDESPLEGKLELLTLFSRMLVELHALDWRPFAPGPAPGEVPKTSALLAQELAQGQALVHQAQMFDFDPVLDWLRERLPGLRYGPPSVTHGDYHPWNVLLREDGAAFVIDWTNQSLSDYRADLAWTLLLMSTYGSAEPRPYILHEYARFARREVEQIEIFDVWACVRRLATILISLGTGAGQMGMRPGAEAMMKDPDHIQKVYTLLRERTSLQIVAVEELLSAIS